MTKFAVIDTETNWHNKVMSVGVVVADDEQFGFDMKYWVLEPEYFVGGMYAFQLGLGEPYAKICSRETALLETISWLSEQGVADIFAYNAAFDFGMLPELAGYRWHDIIRLAAYKQFNRHIPDTAPCYSTGRLKKNYGLQAVLRFSAGEPDYVETHNALWDAYDELRLMRCLGYKVQDYPVLAVSVPNSSNNDK